MIMMEQSKNKTITKSYLNRDKKTKDLVLLLLGGTAASFSVATLALFHSPALIDQKY